MVLSGLLWALLDTVDGDERSGWWLRAVAARWHNDRDDQIIDKQGSDLCGMGGMQHQPTEALVTDIRIALTNLMLPQLVITPSFRIKACQNPAYLSKYCAETRQA